MLGRLLPSPTRPARPARVRAALEAAPLLSSSVLLALALGVAACGHKASDADCAFILDRNVEVQMRAMHINDPVAIDKRKQEIQAELKPQLQGCVGKRITDGMMACVARAQTAEAIDACMR